MSPRNNAQRVSVKEASIWASEYLEREVRKSNISYLIQYGKIKKYNGNGVVEVDKIELREYYKSYHSQRKKAWQKNHDDVNWLLSFDHLSEKDTTKHVHRLHPYKGKFIPQLAEYFLDNHKDDFKKEIFFKRGAIILDPFVGSGTTLVQAQEMGIHAIGIDVSYFNCLLSKVKMQDYDLPSLKRDYSFLKEKIKDRKNTEKIHAFKKKLSFALTRFNRANFPSPDFKRCIQLKTLDEKNFGHKQEREFLKIYRQLIAHNRIDLSLGQTENFLDKWYVANIRDETQDALREIGKIKNTANKQLLQLILSRSLRSCRATTHYDLATLKEPKLETYYCWKHKKICQPLFSMQSWFDRYARDAFSRLELFAQKKSGAHFAVLPGDSRKVDVFKVIGQSNKDFEKLVRAKKINGIFTSPPYVGQIDYHEQHAYAYDLFGFRRNDAQEIGPLYKGQGEKAQKSYIEGIVAVLKNSAQYLTRDAHIFLVANDKYNLYPTIAERTGMPIIQQIKRPVLNRTERDNGPYVESIFHLRPQRMRGAH